MSFAVKLEEKRRIAKESLAIQGPEIHRGKTFYLFSLFCSLSSLYR